MSRASPSEDAVSVHEALSVTVPGGSRATIELTPEQDGATFYVPVVAVSKNQASSYTIEIDGTGRFGPAAIPPTDPDDFGATFIPPLKMENRMQITIKNTDTGQQTYLVQVAGWEER